MVLQEPEKAWESRYFKLYPPRVKPAFDEPVPAVEEKPAEPEEDEFGDFEEEEPAVPAVAPAAVPAVPPARKRQAAARPQVSEVEPAKAEASKPASEEPMYDNTGLGGFANALVGLFTRRRK